MQIGLVGLGRMGANMSRRLENGGHKVTVFDLNPENVKKLVADGVEGASSLADLIKKLPKPPRRLGHGAVWKSDGEHSDGSGRCDGKKATPLLMAAIVFYKDDIRRAAELKKRGIDYLDAGTSGGRVGIAARLLSDDRRVRRGVCPA